LGAKTLLVEKEKTSVGCLHFGCVPSKTLIHTAHVYHLMRRAKNWASSGGSQTRDFREVAKRIHRLSRSSKSMTPRRDSAGWGRSGIRDPNFQGRACHRADGKPYPRKLGDRHGSSPRSVRSGFGTDSLSHQPRPFSFDRLPASMISSAVGPSPRDGQLSTVWGPSVGHSTQRPDLSNEDKDLADGVMEV